MGWRVAEPLFGLAFLTFADGRTNSAPHFARLGHEPLWVPYPLRLLQRVGLLTFTMRNGFERRYGFVISISSSTVAFKCCARPTAPGKM